MGARILVADDSVTIQKVVELTFSKEDFVLLQARSGEEAIRKAREERPDLVLLDLVMPDKTGYEVCAALRAEPTLRSVPIILLAGTFEAFDKEQGFLAGANDFVTKPFESQVLISKVKQQLFAKTVVVGPSGGPPGADKAVPPKEVPRPVPTAAPSPPLSAPSSPPSAGATLFLGTVRTPPSPAPAAPTRQPAAPMAPAPPPPAEPAFELSAPTQELSQEDLWQLLDSTLPQTPPGAPGQLGELSLENLSPTPPPASFEVPSLELPSLEPEPVPEAPAAGVAVEPPSAHAAEGEVVALPESLSLDDLLSAGPAAPAPMPAVEPLLEEAPPAEPLQDLTAGMEAPPLAPIEVGTAQPPTLAVEDLAPPVEVAPFTPTGTGSQDFPELEFEPLPEAPPEAAPPTADLPAPLAPLDLEMPAEPILAEPGPVPSEVGLAEVAAPEDAPLRLGDVAPPPASAPASEVVPEAMSTTAAPEVLEVPGAIPSVAAPPLAPAREVATALPSAPPLEALGLATTPPAREAAGPFPPAVTASEMATMRQAVTERVARELAKDLSDKLLDRIERIVWEVVPDLAEILITKEIERIRGMAEDQKPS